MNIDIEHLSEKGEETVTVLTDDGQLWNVSSHFLKKADGESTEANRLNKHNYN